MSAEYARALMRRALQYLESSRANFDARRFDVAGVEAEIAAQLSLKALIAFLGYEYPRLHKIRELLSFLASKLGEHGREDLREVIVDFSRARRKDLMLLEDARDVGQYAFHGIDEEKARDILRAAEDVVSLVGRLWRELGGEP